MLLPWQQNESRPPPWLNFIPGHKHSACFICGIDTPISCTYSGVLFCLFSMCFVFDVHHCLCCNIMHTCEVNMKNWTAPNHNLNQCWNIVNWTLRNNLQGNFNRNSNILIQENALENFVCEMTSILFRPQWFNSLALGRCGSDIVSVFKLNLRIYILSTSCEIGFRIVAKNPIDDESKLAQVMAWCLQAISHHLSQCWPRSMPPFRVIGPQWFMKPSSEFILTKDSP